jgi:hypothetical protein
MGMECDEAENSRFLQLHLTLVGPAWESMRACFKEIYMQVVFAKRFTKTTLALPVKLLVELKTMQGTDESGNW